MNKEKQIEDMALDIHKEASFGLELSATLAEGLYEKGYRKASSIVRDIFNDLTEMWHKGRGFINYSDLVRLERLHEQKYMEEEK